MEKPLGYIIGNLTGKIAREWRAMMNDNSIRVFNEGYNDRIIYPHRSLNAVFNYIRQNPYRLAVRRERPEFFRRVNGLKVAGKDVQAYGNLFLLRNPFKEQVVVHRADSEAVRAANIERWLYASANGGVLVSPFISKAEKDVRRRAEEEGGRLYLSSTRAWESAISRRGMISTFASKDACSLYLTHIRSSTEQPALP